MSDEDEAEDQTEQVSRREYFSFRDRQKEFAESTTKLIEHLVKQEREQLIPNKNTSRYHHGSGWISTNSNVSDSEEGMERHENVVSVKFDDIIDRNVDAMQRFILSFSEEISHSFARFMYSRIAEICERTGQVASSSDRRSPALAFLDGLKSIQLRVKADGTISKPTFHGGTAALQALARDIEKCGSSWFNEEITRIMQEKEHDAVRREEERKSRFRTLA